MCNMKSFFGIFGGKNRKDISPSDKDYYDTQTTTDIDKVKQYKDEIREIDIKIQPFRLSGLLHILTNKLSNLIKENDHKIYYDVEKEVGRYVVGDNEHIGQVLERLLKDALKVSRSSEIVLKIYKEKDEYLVFDIMNENGLIHKSILKQYRDAKQILSSQRESVNTFVKAKQTAEAMKGELTLESSVTAGTHYLFKVPYYEDKNDKSHQDELREVLSDKKVLFIGKDRYDTQRTQYIFETYGINIDNMQLSDFETKKPNLDQYDMAIIRSADLSYKHISFFKTVYQNEKSDFKIIVVHELFEDEEKIELSKSIAHAQLYSPIIIGDVEEILYQMFVLKSQSVKGINNLEMLNGDTFTIKGKHQYGDNFLAQYKGAHIAIVEDSLIDEKILQNILGKEGIVLFCMHNGSEMLDLLGHEEIDMIFTDINMPIMDGMVMSEKIRSVKKWKHIPIVAVSSMAFPHELKKMEHSGITGAISKPIEAKDIYAALDHFLIMTDSIRMRKKHQFTINYSFDKNILDLEKGIGSAESDETYLESLHEAMEYIRETQDLFENMIYNYKFVALGEYVKKALELYERISAPEMIRMFKDLNYSVSLKQKTYLSDYISLYRKNLAKLEEEIEKYILNRTL